MVQYQIPRETFDTIVGSKADFDAAIAAYAQALKDHSKTVDKPAPVAPNAWIEAIVKRGGGKYEIIEPEAAPTFAPDEALAAAYARLEQASKTFQNSGVTFKGVTFKSTIDALTMLLAVTMAGPGVANWSGRWKIGPGQFIAINYDDVLTIIALIHDKYQSAFRREEELSESIIASIGMTDRLLAMKFDTGWGE